MNKQTKKVKKQADERQTSELLRIEHATYWITFFALLVSIVVQSILQVPFTQMAAEWIVFMISCLVLCIGCISKGVWSFRTNKVPGVKSYFLYSIIGLLIGLAFGITTVAQFGINEISVIATILAVDGIVLYFGCFFVFLIVGKIAKHRERKLEEKAIAEFDDDEE